MRRTIGFLACLIVGCGQEAPPERELAAILDSGTFVRMAQTTVGGDRLDFWQDPEDTYFGSLLIVAHGDQAGVLDFWQGQFTSSARPFCQNGRYCALVAATPQRGRVFVLYDSRDHRFRTHPVPPDVHSVHEGMVLVGERVLYASDKTPEPVRLLELASGAQISLGRSAPQSARFHVDGARVLIYSAAEGVFELDGTTLRPSSARAPGFDANADAFDRIRISRD